MTARDVPTIRAELQEISSRLDELSRTNPRDKALYLTTKRNVEHTIFLLGLTEANKEAIGNG